MTVNAVLEVREGDLPGIVTGAGAWETGSPSGVRILLLEDNPLDAELLVECLNTDGLSCEVTRVEDAESFAVLLRDAPIDLVLSDYSLPTYDGLSALEATKAVRPELPFIFVSGALGEERAIEAMRHGATDYVLKERLSRLGPAVRRALTEAEERRERRLATETTQRLQTLADDLAGALAASEIARVAVVHGMAALGATSGACWMLDRSREELALIHAEGYTPRTASSFARVRLDCNVPVAQALRERAPLWIRSRPDYRDRFPDSEAGTDMHSDDTAAACMPLCLKSVQIGALAFTFDSSRRFTSAERRLLLALSQSCAQALERARLFEEAREASRRFELLARASQMLSSSLDFEVTLFRVADLVVPELADICLVDIIDPGHVVRRLTKSRSSPADEAPRTLSLDAVQVPALSSGKTVHVCTDDAGFAEQVANVTKTHVLTEPHFPDSMLSVPLIHRGRTLGAITLLVHDRSRRHDRVRVALAEELALRAAVALDHASVFEMAQRERARVEQANRAKDEFLAIVSHELRTPLQSILGWARMLRTGRLPPEKQARALDIVERNAQLQSELISDLLDVARIASGKLEIEREEVMLGQVVEACIDAARPAAATKSISMVAEVDEDATVTGDATRLQQVLTNLLTNALKFTGHGGQITVRLDVLDERVELSVRDTGQGIDPAFLPHVFEQFRQASSDDARTHGGLGLGLAIVKHLVHLHSGTVRAESDGCGKGATFAVCLPLRRDDKPRLAAVVSVECCVRAERGAAGSTSAHRRRRRRCA